MRMLVWLVIGFIIVSGFTTGHRLRDAKVEPTGDSVAAFDSDRTDTTTRSATAGPVSVAGETTLLRAPDGHFYADAEVNYGRVHFMVDTGATVVALSQADAMAANVRFDPGQFEVVGSGASGPVYGQDVMIDSIAVDGKRAQSVPGVVLRDANMSLLGQAYLRELQGTAIEGDRMVLR